MHLIDIFMSLGIISAMSVPPSLYLAGNQLDTYLCTKPSSRLVTQSGAEVCPKAATSADIKCEWLDSYIIVKRLQ